MARSVISLPIGFNVDDDGNIIEHKPVVTEIVVDNATLKVAGPTFKQLEEANAAYRQMTGLD